MNGSSENGSSELMGLSAALEGLREELESAWQEGAGKAIRFRVSEVTLTLEPVARRDAKGGWEDPLVAGRGRRRCHGE